VHAAHLLLRREEIRGDDGRWREPAEGEEEAAPGRGSGRKLRPGEDEGSVESDGDEERKEETGSDGEGDGLLGGVLTARDAKRLYMGEAASGMLMDRRIKRTVSTFCLRLLGHVLRRHTGSRQAFADNGIALTVLSVLTQALQP